MNITSRKIHGRLNGVFFEGHSVKFFVPGPQAFENQTGLLQGRLLDVDPLEPAVVTVGSLHAGIAANVIPDEARMLGTLRSFREDVRALLRERVREVIEGSARAHGCRAGLEIRPGYPVVVNDAEAVERVRRAGAATLGAANVVESPPLAASEDFAYFLQRVPGAFFLLGAGNPERGMDAPHHSPRFDFDESVLPKGAEILARLALDV